MSNVPDIVEGPEEPEGLVGPDISGFRGQISVRTGPLPPPDDFRQYEETLPGAADRILRMAENQNERRNNREDARLRTTGRTMTLGTVIWGAILIASLGAGTFLVYTEKTISVGAGVALLPLGTLAVGYLKRVFSSPGRNGSNGAEPPI